MPLQDDLTAKLFEMMGKAPSIEEGQRLLMLAGNNLAQPMANLRARQSQREYQRLAKRLPKNHPRRVAALLNAKTAKLQVRAVEAEVDRLTVEPREAGPGLTGVHGYIRSDGKAVAGVEVSLNEISGDPKGPTVKPRATVETDQDGMFALCAPSPGPLRLQVKAKDELLFADKEAVYVESGQSHYRLLDLAKAGRPFDFGDEEKKGTPDNRLIEDKKDVPVKPEPDPDPPSNKPDPALSGDLRGKTLFSALKLLRERNVAVRLIHLVEEEVSTPEVRAIENASDERSVILHVVTSPQPAAKLKVAAAVLASMPDTDGTKLGTVSGAGEWMRANKIQSLSDLRTWSEQSEEAIGKKLKLRRLKQAGQLRPALIATSGLIKET